MAQEDTAGLGPVTQLLSDPAHWCKHSLAQDRDGEPTDHNGPHAVSYCLVGAIMRCYPFAETRNSLITNARAVAIKRGFDDIVDFNNQSDHDEVLAFCKELSL